MIADLIPAVAAAEINEDRKQHKYSRRPSLAGPSRCIRQLVYKALDYPAALFEGRTALIFDDGSWHEELTLDWIRKSSLIVLDKDHVLVKKWIQEGRLAISDRGFTKGQFELKTAVGKGHPDGLILDPANEVFVLEHKALNCYTYDAFFKGSRFPSDYLTQIALSIRATAEQGIATKGILLIKNKNNAQYMEYQLEYDFESDSLTIVRILKSTGEVFESGEVLNDIVRNAVEKFDMVDDYKNKNELPPRQYYIKNDSDGWICEYCDFGAECWKNFENEFAVYKKNNDLGNDISRQITHAKECEVKAKQLTTEAAMIYSGLEKDLFSRKVQNAFAGDWELDLKLKTSNKTVKEKLSADQNRKLAAAEKALVKVKEEVSPAMDAHFQAIKETVDDLTGILNLDQINRVKKAVGTINDLKLKSNYLKMEVKKIKKEGVK